MKQDDLIALREFMATAERVRGVLVQEGLLPNDSTIQQMSAALVSAATKLGKNVGMSSLVVFVDYLYSMGNYAPIKKPHVTLEWLITEAVDVYTYAKNQSAKR